MTVAKIIEVVGESTTSWDDAVRTAVKQASKTVRNITGVEVLNLTGEVNEEGDIVEYRADVQIAFAVDGTD